jgi:hypothetical protein
MMSDQSVIAQLPPSWWLFDFDRAISMLSGLRPAGCGCSGIVSGEPSFLCCGIRRRRVWLADLDAIPDGDTGEPQSGYLVGVDTPTAQEAALLQKLAEEFGDAPTSTK